MLKKNKVFFKGKGNGLIIVLDEESSFDELRDELLEKTKKSKTFFMGASEDIKFEGKELTSEEENMLAEIIISNAGMEIGFINPEHNENFGIKKREGVNKLLVPDKPEQSYSEPKETFGEMRSGVFESGEKVLIYNGFVRSGKLVESDGNIVIIGGVNPGGEVFAGRNIMIFGQLKGKAVAGRNGDESSFIAAIHMEPELLGISSYVTRFPKDKKDALCKAPSTARLQDNKIIISPIGNMGASK